MKLIISNVSGIPIYEQIKQQIKAAIFIWRASSRRNFALP